MHELGLGEPRRGEQPPDLVDPGGDVGEQQPAHAGGGGVLARLATGQVQAGREILAGRARASASSTSASRARSTTRSLGPVSPV